LRILPLRGAIKHYAWGSRTALADWLGRPGPSPEPEAELWLGAHPSGPAEVEIGGRWEPLDRWLARDQSPLPFLLKLLAVERPLSLQVHPDAEQARAGFERERERPAGERRYSDPFAKPELVCALTPFTALCGFRPADEVAARLAALGAAEIFPAAGDEASRLAGFLGGWLGASREARRSVLGRLRAAARGAAPRDPASAWLLRLDAEYPDDPGVLAPLFLHLVELAPGEALFLPPGELHCYLAGVAVELMGSSDNVLRGGLTPKPVYVDELLRVARFAARRPPLLRPLERRPGASAYPTPADEFELSLLEPNPDRPVTVARPRGLEVLWCASGSVRVVAGDSIVVRERGQSCLVREAAQGYRVEGAGRVYRAAAPEP
jgi:mannose-6-phosphate isomerase